MCKPFLLTAVALLLAWAPVRAADGDEKLVKVLVSQLMNPANKPAVRTTALQSLTELGWTGRAALPDLIKLLDSPLERKLARDTVGSWDTMGPYYFAIEALGRMGPGAKEAAPVLIRAKSAVPAFDQAVDFALRNILQPADPTAFSLLVSLRDNDPVVRLAAAKALRRYPAELGLVEPALLQAAKSDPDFDVRLVAEDSAREVVLAEVTRLVGLLKDRDENVRLLAAKALGRLGSRADKALPALKEVTAKDADADVRCVASLAIKKIQGQP